VCVVLGWAGLPVSWLLGPVSRDGIWYPWAGTPSRYPGIPQPVPRYP